ncbi:hypothetical protein J3R30DRAFT_3835781 [Lentinula aciculospora]|uniref:FAD/NAD(P)-binding domain-containing protein n=1 Tax=Lentinula aciculospora TaxID=153920 RepID=A0A9W9AJV5_9AGAR|nr:hypothetical protein J3R30DRAFT_3835781 [Lentinula aciculospora]
MASHLTKNISLLTASHQRGLAIYKWTLSYAFKELRPEISMIATTQLLLLTLGCLYGSLILGWKLLRRYLFKRHSGIPEIEKLGETLPVGQKLDGTAVICGGSIAGLLAARVCFEFFKHVVIIEPEEWLATEDSMRRFGWEQQHKRTRIMQYRSLHGNQALLYTGLQKLFPDIDEQFRYSGIAVYPADRKANFAGTLIPAPVKSYQGHLPKTFCCSRAGLETLLRRLVLGRGSYPNITQIAGTVIGILPQSNDFSRLSRVKIRKADMQMEELNASLVIDCTGVTRAGMKWLSQTGYGITKDRNNGKIPLQDAKISLDQKLHYSTLTCNVTPATLEKLQIPKIETVHLEEKNDEGRRLFVLGKTDGDRIVVFAGQSSDTVVRYDSLNAMRTFVQDFRTYKDPLPDWIFESLDILEESQPDIHFSHVRAPPTSYVQYHKTVNLPSNFIALGDSVSSVDPIYGQGCTKAFLGAVVLDSVLRAKLQAHAKELPADFSEQFFKEHFYKTDIFWWASANLMNVAIILIWNMMLRQFTHVLDYGIPSTTPIQGESLQVGSLVRWYLRRLQILATKDEQAARVCWDISMGFNTSVDIFHPWLVLKVFFNTIIE